MTLTDQVVLMEKGAASVAKVYYIRGYTYGSFSESLSLGTMTIHQSTLWKDIMQLVKHGAQVRISGYGLRKSGGFAMSFSICSLRKNWESMFGSLSILTKGLLENVLLELESVEVCQHELFNLVSAMHDDGCFVISFMCDSNSSAIAIDPQKDKC